MIAFRILSRCRLLCACAALSLASAGAAMAAETTSAVTYDIPAQALDSALNAYIGTSGAQVFYETALTAGRRSTEVKGRLTSEAALETLLIGTGLVGRRADIDAFIVTLAPQERQSGTSAMAVAQGSRFVSALQAGILATLCGNAQTRPGSYRIALELWISPNGAVQRTELIGSTGDAMRDALLGSVLQGVAIDAVPPPGTPQPLIMAIAPRPPNQTGDCAGQ
jgi:hypothetical protein